MAKSRLAPIKPVTIPRMELSAAVLATRLDTMIRQEIDCNINQSYFWTDSTCVLRYIENDKRRFQTFVSNPVAAILDVSSPSQWQYVDSNSNPADDASRGLSANELIKSKRWLHAPEFLWGSAEHWSKRPASIDEVEEDDPEVKKSAKIFGIDLREEVDTTIHNIFSRISSWVRLKEAIAWLLRYKAKLKVARERRQLGASMEFSHEVQPINVDEIKNVEREILRLVQRESFLSEITALHHAKRMKMDDDVTGQRVKNAAGRNSPLRQLDPFLSEDGLIRVGGRLGRAPISDEARQQVILPRQHHVVELIIRHYHEVSGHSGQEYVLSLIRQRYWIIKARTTLRRLLSACFRCRRQAPIQEQKMAHLPEDRVTPSKPPFSFVGVDSFGPYHVLRGRTIIKRYGVIFTCLAIRAVHIKIVHSLDTQSFINALRRFIARRGYPEEIRSNNGGNFVSANKELRDAIKEWNQNQIQQYLTQNSVKWVFNPPAGSHHGGVWERCIRTVNAICKEQTMDDQALSTLMCEVETIINGQPITKVSDDPNNFEALTPNHLLLLRTGAPFPPGLFNKTDCYVRRRRRQVQYLSNVFWHRWLKEYLPTLQ
ncbi:uncharacterized protein [Montipora capricornis]|uniref:uncharacterized protein n=1 Tax=Montipora capricornis TaxID=246305 RepID=UPI0035F12164